jgi:ubiquinone/menaquinone biosynthesis C-methylase UbiE
MTTRTEAHAAQIEMYGDTTTDAGFGEGLMQDVLQDKRIQIARENIPSGVEPVVDVGCGQGIITQSIASSNRVIGVELVHSRVAYTKDIFATPMYVCADGAFLPLPSLSTKAVCAFEVLEHMIPSDTIAALYEFYRVLKVGGVLILSTPNLDGIGNRLRRNLKPTMSRRDHFNEMSYRYLLKIVKEAGFKVNHLEGIGLIPGLWHVQKIFNFRQLYEFNNAIARFLPQISTEVSVVATKIK